MSALGAILAKLIAGARAEGRTRYVTLRSGLQVAAFERDGRTVLALSRPGHPKGPSTQEAATCAKHAGWARYGLKGNPEDKTLYIWKEDRP